MIYFLQCTNVTSTGNHSICLFFFHLISQFFNWVFAPTQNLFLILKNWKSSSLGLLPISRKNRLWWLLNNYWFVVVVFSLLGNTANEEMVPNFLMFCSNQDYLRKQSEIFHPPPPQFLWSIWFRTEICGLFMQMVKPLFTLKICKWPIEDTRYFENILWYSCIVFGRDVSVFCWVLKNVRTVYLSFAV